MAQLEDSAPFLSLSGFLDEDYEIIQQEGGSPLHRGLAAPVVVEVQGSRFGVPREKLLLSEFFRDLIYQSPADGPQEGTAEYPLNLDDIPGLTAFAMDSFIRVLDARIYDPAPEMSLDQYVCALELASSWGFDSVRAWLISTIDRIAYDPVDRIELADRFQILPWIVPAMVKLAAREATITETEGVRLGFKRFAILCEIREERLQKIHARKKGGVKVCTSLEHRRCCEHECIGHLRSPIEVELEAMLTKAKECFL